MTTRWFEIRIALEKDEPTSDVISSTFQKAVLPLYQSISFLSYIKRGHYLTEPHSGQDSRTPFVWMVRWEVENWEQNNSELREKASEFLGKLGYVNSEIEFKKNMVYYVTDDNAEHDKKIFTEKYADLFFDIMSATCKFQEGVLNHDSQKNPELTEHKVIHCILNAYGKNSEMELTFYITVALGKYLQVKGTNQFNEQMKQEFMKILDDYFNRLIQNNRSADSPNT